MTRKVNSKNIKLLKNIKVNGPHYSKEQFNFGLYHEKVKKDYHTAMVYYKKVSQKENAFYYAQAQFRLGKIHSMQFFDYKQAIICYQNVLNQDDLELYSKAQYQLGSLYQFDMKDEDKAISHYNAVQKFNSHCYSSSQYHLSEIYFDRNELSQAFDHYSHVSYYSLKPYEYIDACIFLRLFKNGGEKENIKKSCNR